MGMYYYFIRKNDTVSYTPQKGDLVTMTYGIYYVEGDTIYLPEEIGVKTYTVDKEEYFAGLRAAVKMMKEGEEAVFYIPSYLGYGLLGDADRIAGNTPLKLHLKILEIQRKKDTL
jgi:gliding motility-associated peptidyl-prolyl isomerase